MDKDMRELVQAGYEQGHYGEAFRSDLEPNPFETRFLDLLTQHVPAGAHILDMGSGTGIPYDRYLVGKGYILTGVDFSQKHLALARQNVPQANYLYGDFSRVSFAPESFDAILSFYAIFHVPRQEHLALFAKMYRTLKPKGIMLVTLGVHSSEYGEEADWLGAPMAWSTYDSNTYKYLLKETGFALLDCDFEGQPSDEEHHLWVLAQKR